MRTSLFLVGFLATALSATSAAALQQPNGATIPAPLGCGGGKPTGLGATFACICSTPGVCNIGGTCPSSTSCPNGQNATCETTLWHSYNDNSCIPSNISGLNPATDGALTPETFRPSCGLTFKVVTRGTAIFGDIFGWYNVTGSKPSPSDLHPMLGCTDGAGSSVNLDVKSDPSYAGGDIGFFLLTPEGGQSKACAGGDCCASIARYQQGVGHLYFSERKYNADNTGPNPFVHLVVYDSKITPRKFYFAWEDIYGGSNNDFSDLVTSVDGVECSGGGEPCETGEAGRCGRGMRTCKNGVLVCAPMLGPGPEACNGVDDDCNGKIDDEAKCPNPGEKCHQGRCVGSCARGEFPCPTSFTCDPESGFCLPKACVGVKCPDGQYCRDGKCGPACEGVICPKGLTCVGDTCLDLCAGVKCNGGETCRDGVCVAGCTQCGGIQCSAGLKCEPSSGACIDPSCAQPCPTGTFCEAGQCKDACIGAKCPDGQVCSKGSCVDPSQAGPQSSGGLTPNETPGGASSSDVGFNERDRSGCGCDTTKRTSGTLAMAAALLVAGAVVRRRRER